MSMFQKKCRPRVKQAKKTSLFLKWSALNFRSCVAWNYEVHAIFIVSIWKGQFIMQVHTQNWENILTKRHVNSLRSFIPNLLCVDGLISSDLNIGLPLFRYFIHWNWKCENSERNHENWCAVWSSSSSAEALQNDKINYTTSFIKHS